MTVREGMLRRSGMRGRVGVVVLTVAFFGAALAAAQTGSAIAGWSRTRRGWRCLA